MRMLIRAKERCASVLAALVVLSFLPGCASILKGGNTTVPVSASPPDALIEVHEFGPQGPLMYKGHAPAKVKLSKKHEYVVIASAPGFESEQVKLTQGFQAWTIGNVILIVPLFWGAGVAVDAATGALWTLDDDDVVFSLRPAVPAPAIQVKVAPPPPSSLTAL
jgi:hypothetical protein